MRVEYRNPDIIDMLDAAIEEARAAGRRIDNIRLTGSELAEFCNKTGMLYTKQSHYTYKHIIIAYDWSGCK